MALEALFTTVDFFLKALKKIKSKAFKNRNVKNMWFEPQHEKPAMVCFDNRAVSLCVCVCVCVCVFVCVCGVWLGPCQAVVSSRVLAVVGEKEKMTNSVNVRTRDNKVHGELSLAEVLARLTLLKQSRCRNAEEEFWSRWRNNPDSCIFITSAAVRWAVNGQMMAHVMMVEWKCSM